LLRGLDGLDGLRGLRLCRLGGLQQLLRLHRAEKLLARRAVAQKMRQSGGIQSRQSRCQAGARRN